MVAPGRQPVRIEGGLRTEITREIIDILPDGSVVVCDGYVDPNGDWHRDSKQTIEAPFRATIPIAAGDQSSHCKRIRSSFNRTWFLHSGPGEFTTCFVGRASGRIDIARVARSSNSPLNNA